MLYYLQTVQQKLWQIETFILVATFIVTLMVAITQISLRNFFDMGIVWADTFLRISVLWLGMMGALVASRKNSHISMNLGQKYLNKKNLRWVKTILHFFTAFICFIITWYGVNLVLMEYDEASIAFANVPVWLTMTIIPIAFLIMALRYLGLTILIAINYPVIDQPEYN